MIEAQDQTLLALRIAGEADIVAARQRARQLATLLGFQTTDQVGLATAVSEIVRNAVMYAGQARVDFALEMNSRPPFFRISVTDHGSGLTDAECVLAGKFQSKSAQGAGITGARRLTERFEISSQPNQETVVRFGKTLPAHSAINTAGVERLKLLVAQQPAPGPQDALREQNYDLIRTLDALRARENEVETRRKDLERLSLELAETNRGVVALYAELEEQAAALRRANQLKSQFLSYVSHEFRTPVNSVLALTQILIRRTDGELTAEQEKQVQFIRKAVEGLAEMVNDLLDLAKVESGKTEIRTGIVEVGQVLGAVRALMRPLATNDAVKLVFEEPLAGLVIETDEGKLGQILRNLVSNALKFTEHGEVRVCTRLDAPGKQIAFSVQDTGIGIAPEHVELIFQEFSQIQHSLQGRSKGTGLGLPLSRKLAELLGGTLEVSSESGAGSTFILTLPANIPAHAGAHPDIVEHPDRGHAAILVVDDEETSRYVCRHMFRGSPYRIIESDALEAAERARFERPELIVLDLMMPGRTGFEVLDELKGDPTTREIPVVIHTSKTISSADDARLAGRHIGVLAKSGINRKEVFEVIRQVLGNVQLFADEPEYASASPANRANP
jgi:signal transduction histidine kinase/CheY-like chemotaxis protein